MSSGTAYSKWAEVNRERIRATAKAWRYKNRDKFLAIQARYAKTPRGFLLHRYDAMRNRVTNPKLPKYLGLDILPKEDFYDWALRDETFHRMYCEWMARGKERRLTPTVNRIDTSIGYVLGNMEWMPWGENSRLAGISRGKR